MPSQNNREWYVDVAAGDGELWLLSSRLSSVTANSSHRRNRSLCIPRGVRVQSNCNVHTNCPQSARYFWMPPPWCDGVENTSGFEASPFPFDSGLGQTVSSACESEITLKAGEATVYTQLVEAWLTVLSQDAAQFSFAQQTFSMSFSAHLSNTLK